MKDDASLLAGYARNRSESDFAELVRRHVNLVYSAALRQVNGDVHLAQDVTQTVFTDLARKARSLTGHRVLAGWLFTSTRFAAAKVVRGEQRRRRREQEAHTMQEISASDGSSSLDWARLRPVLDDALAELTDRDRDAILLRYLEGRDFTEVGNRLALSDNAARMRVDRAVDKLRLLLARRGVTSTAGALALMLANQTVVAAPVGLANVVAATALTAGSATAATVFTFMSMTKLQMVATGAVLAAGLGGYFIQEKTNTTLRTELTALQKNDEPVAQLREKNRQLAQAATEASHLKVDDTELKQLSTEAAAVQSKLQTTAASQQAAAAKSSGPSKPTYDISELDRRPQLSKPVQPVYPYAMSKAGIEGKVTVDFVIDATGKVVHAHVLNSTHREFEASTLAAINQWRFVPGVKGGTAVGAHATQLIEFALAEKTEEDPTESGPTWF